MFKSFYDKKRFRYIDHQINKDDRFNVCGGEIIPKTACFFSDKLDVYIDTSDGVNDDLKIYEYCGRILSCIRMSKGKRFIFFKAAHSYKWSAKIRELAEANNGKVIPFFKWSFNDSFYKFTLGNIDSLRAGKNSKYDIGLFADFNKQYSYPKPSSVDSRISCYDHGKFGITGNSVDTGQYAINSRPEILTKVNSGKFSVFAQPQKYEKYMRISNECKSTINPPGIGEYTSRMMDQTAVGNLIVLRKNSYDNGNSWKKYIPEIDFTTANWEDQYENILNNAEDWRKKGLYYYEKLWSPIAVFDYFIDKITEEL